MTLRRRLIGGCLLVLLTSNLAAAGPCKSAVLPPPGSPPPPVFGFAGPSYRWGWFNTKYWPRKVTHRGFNGDYWQWGYQQGY
jgi:hypothetical protein